MLDVNLRDAFRTVFRAEESEDQSGWAQSLYYLLATRRHGWKRLDTLAEAHRDRDLIMGHPSFTARFCCNTVKSVWYGHDTA